MTGNEPPAPPATPPADPAAGGNNQPPAQTPAPQPGQNPPNDGNIWTPVHQEIFDRRFAEKMGAMERELGIQPGGLKDYVATQKAAAQKQKLPAGDTLTGPELRMAKMEALMLQGISGKQIPVILENFNIKGKTREEIDASIQQLITVGLLKIEAPAPEPGTQPQQPPGPPQAAQGAGNNGVPGNPAKKTWKRSEIQAHLQDPTKTDPKILDEINLAQREGRVDYNS